jgi:two-component system, OmpR family, sensor kinase
VTGVPIRVKLTLAFTAAMAVILAVAGLLLYLRLETALDQGINQSLHAQLAEVTALTRQADTGLKQGVPAGQGGDIYAQVITPRGAVIDATPQLRGLSILTLAELSRALAGPLQVDFSSLTAFHGSARLLAAPVHAQGQRVIVLVGTSLTDRNQALQNLRTELLVGGPAALVLVALAGYLLARAALRPVERLRVETQELSASNLDRRLTLPKADDEIRRLGLTLNALLARLEASLARERRFVADASHELRTPLALLKTELDLAQSRPRTHAELAAAVRSAGAETDHITHLAEDLLVLARADESGLPLHRSPTQVGELLERVARRFKLRATNAQRSITVDADGAGVAHIDPARLEQALSNLIDNALRHGNGAITLRAARHHDQLELHVHDEGTGFPPEFLPRAFERFSHPDHARTGRSAGLGLAIVAAVAHAHGGTATAANTHPKGSDVHITLPQA